MHLIFDMSLLAAKAWLAPPSGIDRVEYAHLRRWRQLPADEVTFVMRTAWNRLAIIPAPLLRPLLAELDRTFATGASSMRLRFLSGLIMYAHFWGLGRRKLIALVRSRPDCVLVTVSCATLHMRDALADLKKHGCRIVPLIHDMIPITHPQYMPPIEFSRHQMRIQNLANLCDAGLIVSHAALVELERYAARRKLRLPRMTVAHPGLDLAPATPEPGRFAEVPYFVILGSLEPRKNHLMLLQLWERLKSAPNCPKLIIIGRPPKHPNEATAALESTDFGGRVEYLGRLDDASVAKILGGARALLFPSKIEGFGIPLSEALAGRTPAIVSDLPAFREHGKDVPEYLPPDDLEAWRLMILDYAKPESERRTAQLQRLQHWTAPTWDAHFAVAEALLRETTTRPRSIPLTR